MHVKNNLSRNITVNLKKETLRLDPYGKKEISKDSVSQELKDVVAMGYISLEEKSEVVVTPKKKGEK